MSVLGGAGSLEDIGQLIQGCGVIGAAAGSLFVFKGPYRAVVINYPNALERQSLAEKANADAGT
jgi:cyclase